MNEDNKAIYTALIKMAVKQARMITDDQEALAVKCLYKQWEKQLGRQLEVGEYVQYDGRLYRVLQQHVVQATWIPGVGTESLYVVIDKTHSGTIDDKIPWVANMECFNGKYYIEDGISYLCIRDSGIALQCKIVDVLGNYFVVVNENGEQVEDEVVEEEPPIEEGGEEEVEEQPKEEEVPNEDENTEIEEPPTVEDENDEVVEEPKEEEEVVTEEGTLENPIQYVVGATPLVEGKYYIENDIVYLCNRSEVTLYHSLSALVGLYVTVVE